MDVSWVIIDLLATLELLNRRLDLAKQAGLDSINIAVNGVLSRAARAAIAKAIYPMENEE